MKKILSAVFVMTMLMLTATFAGSVLAAEPYQYTPDDGLPVVYVSSTGEINSSLTASNGKEYKTIGEAVSALTNENASVGGYLVILDDVIDEKDVDDPSTDKDNDDGTAGEKTEGKNGGYRYIFPTTNGKPVIIRGRDDLSEFPKIYLRYMCSVTANSDYAFENVHLYFRKFHKGDNDQSLQCGSSKVTFGRAGDPDSIKVSGMETLTGSQFTINGGYFGIRMATWGSDVTYNNVNIVLNGGTLTGVSGAHSGPTNKVFGTDCLGDFSITVNGGTFRAAGVKFGRAKNNRFNVNGDFKFTVNGGTLSESTIKPVTAIPAEFKISGNTIVDILGYNGDKAALAAKFPASEWDLIMSDEIYVSDAGDDTAAGTADAPVATFAKAVELLGTAGGVVNIKDTLTVDSYTEAARTAPIVITGDTLVVNGDFSLGGSTMFMGVDVKNGTNGAIVAGGNELSIMADVTTSVGEDGKYIDLIAGKRGEFVTVDITVKAGTYNVIDPSGLAEGSVIAISAGVTAVESGVRADGEINALKLSKGNAVNSSIELIDFVNDQQAMKISPAADVAAIEYDEKINAKVYKFVSFEYYLNLKDTDTVAVRPQLVINGVTYDAEQQTAVNGWNVASFDLSGISTTVDGFTLYPYGQTAVAEYNKMYVFSIKMSQLKSVSAPDYGTISLTSKGDFIPVLDDYVMTTDELVNTTSLSNVEVSEAPFVAGPATIYTPAAETGISTGYNVLVDGSVASMRGAFQPYVRVEYYMYARETDVITEAYPTLKIGSNTYVSTQALVANQWAVATFNIGSYEDAYQSFTFLPYGEASGLNTWNKLYVQQIVFSQTENTAAPTYSKPDMTENGELVPYIFDPAEEGLEVYPVIYVNVNGGILTSSDPIESSKDSTRAYGSLSAAITAANASKQIVYIVMVDDIVVGSTGDNNKIGYVNHSGNLPTNNNTIIIRGMTKSDDTRTKFYVSRMPRVGGHIWFQNIDLVSASSGDTYLALLGNNMSFGTPNGSDTDVTFGKYDDSCASLVITFGGDGGAYAESPVIDIYSGKINTNLKLSGAYGATTMQGDVTVNVYGGDLTGTEMTNGHSIADKNLGDVNINISGGKFGTKTWQLVNNENSYVEGDINVKISGNPSIGSFGGFTIAPYKESNTTGHKGTSTVDILEYEGADFEALKAKVSNFDVKFINSVYLKDGGTGDGSSVANACGSLEKAFAACYKENEDGTIEGGRIVICGDGFTVEGTVEAPANAERILITSDGSAAIKFVSGTLSLAGPINFKNITFASTNADDAIIEANGNTVVFDTGIKCQKTDDGKYISVVGGAVSGTAAAVDVTINSGDFNNVTAGDSVEGDVSIVINGGTIHGNIVGGTSAADGVIGGNVAITVNDGSIKGNIIGASNAENGIVEGSVYVALKGGTYSADTTIVATNNSNSSSITGTAEINITGGDFSALKDGQIQPGNGVCGDKTCVDYKYYTGSNSVDELSRVIADTFDVTVELLQPKPVFTSADKFIFIIQSIGDPTKALTKTIPFKITQSVAQSGTPVVVSPKQLNLKMDGSDHATMTLQTVKDTVDTIRFVPNHNPTKGSAIVVDGCNINGRGVEVPKYKYIEIVYYYTVPEGETPAVTNMTMRYLGEHNKVAATSSETLVPNKWTSTIIDMSAAVEGTTGNLKQYHFYPMGQGKKGAEVPVTQYLDIASLTFYTDKPHTTIQ